MYKYSERSMNALKTCDVRLQFLFLKVIEQMDCSIIEGHRGKEKQNKYYEDGLSRVQFPAGKHNVLPSKAIDAVPYPINWDTKDEDNLRRYHRFAYFVLGMAKAYGIKLRWGGDWDSDNEFDDQTLNDLPHFELTEE